MNTELIANALTQDEIDKEQIMAGAKVGLCLIELVKADPSKFDKKEVEHTLSSLIIPERFKDVSCNDMQDKILKHYITEASMAMNANFMKGEYVVAVIPKHKKFVTKLTEHWAEKGFNVSITNYENGSTNITIDWSLDGVSRETLPENPEHAYGLYGVFIMYTEDEGNVVYEFACLSDSLHNSRQIVSILSETYNNIKPRHKEISSDNNFTYVGNRIDLIAGPGGGFGSINGFVIESLKIGKICISNNDCIVRH